MLITFTTFFVALTYVSLGLGMGGYFANYSERSPVRIASSRGATMTLLLGLVFNFNLRRNYLPADNLLFPVFEIQY
jgi:hypothetical protein